jgi:hypothetical protein
MYKIITNTETCLRTTEELLNTYKGKTFKRFRKAISQGISQYTLVITDIPNSPDHIIVFVKQEVKKREAKR